MVFFLVSILFFLLVYLLYKRQINIIKSFHYEVALITDNLGKKEFKIVVINPKQETAIIAEKLNIIKGGLISKRAYQIFKSSWENKEEALKQFEKLRIHLGIDKYEQDIKVIKN